MAVQAIVEPLTLIFAASLKQFFSVQPRLRSAAASGPAVRLRLTHRCLGMAEEPASNDGDESIIIISDGRSAAEVAEASSRDMLSELRPGTASSTGMGLKLDVTMVLNSPALEDKTKKPELPLFSMVSINPDTAPTIEVPWSQLLALSLAHE